jgi:hypothetical protein
MKFRIQLIILFGFGGLAQLVGVSVQHAESVAGLALTTAGKPGNRVGWPVDLVAEVPAGGAQRPQRSHRRPA